MNGGAGRAASSEPMVVSLAPDGSAGASVARALAHQAPGVLHLAVSVQVVDAASGGWLLQRRATTKALFPNRWANTCCTHPAPGEDPATAAVRRLREETGLLADEVVAAGSFTYRAIDDESGLVEHEHDRVFVAVVDARAANPDPEEIAELALLPFEEAVQLLQSEASAPWAASVLTRSHAALTGNRRLRPAPARPLRREEGDTR